jgi:hypothetical protein
MFLFVCFISGQRDLDEGVERSGGQVSSHRLRRCSRTVSRSHGALQVCDLLLVNLYYGLKRVYFASTDLCLIKMRSWLIILKIYRSMVFFRYNTTIAIN